MYIYSNNYTFCQSFGYLLFHVIFKFHQTDIVPFSFYNYKQQQQQQHQTRTGERQDRYNSTCHPSAQEAKAQAGLKFST